MTRLVAAKPLLTRLRFLRLLLRADRLEALPFLDRDAEQLAGSLRVGLRAPLELGRGAADETAGRAVAARVESRVAVRAMDLERAVRLEEPEALGLGEQRLRVFRRHQYASTTDFFSRHPSRPSMPCSFPNPDCFVPPKGSWSYATWMSLIQAQPAAMSSAAFRA